MAFAAFGFRQRDDREAAGAGRPSEGERFGVLQGKVRAEPQKKKKYQDRGVSCTQELDQPRRGHGDDE